MFKKIFSRKIHIVSLQRNERGFLEELNQLLKNLLTYVKRLYGLSLPFPCVQHGQPTET